MPKGRVHAGAAGYWMIHRTRNEGEGTEYLPEHFLDGDTIYIGIAPCFMFFIEQFIDATGEVMTNV